MSDHRRTVSPRVFVLPGWVLVLVAVLCLGGAGWLGWIVYDETQGESTSAAPAPSATTPSPTASESPEPTESEPTPEPTPEPTEAEPTQTGPPAPDRGSIAVSVLNASTTAGLARSASAQVQAAGWTVGTVGNWRGSVAANAVHYPVGREAEARLLADDLGIAQTAPSLNGMSTERLTVLLITSP